MTLPLPNQAIMKTVQLPLYQNSKKKQKNLLIFVYIYLQLLYLTLANLESLSKVKFCCVLLLLFFFFLFFYFSFSCLFSPIFFKFSELILFVMCHRRSQMPTTLVPINQPKKSQSHGEEYIKRIAMGLWGLTTIVYVVINHG